MLRLPPRRLGPFLGFALIALTAGCQANPDPAQAGFFGGVANLANGTYDQRVADRQATLARTEQLRQDMSQRAERAQAERRQSEAELANRQRMVANLDDQLAELERRLRQAQADRRHDGAALAQAEQQLAGLRQRRDRIAQSGQPVDPATRQQVQQQMDTLRNAVNAISGS